MSIVNDKKNVFTSLGALSSTKDMVKKSNNVNSLSSVNNKKEVMPFLLDLVSSLVGAAGIALIIGKTLSNSVDIIEPKLKASLKKQFIGINSNKLLSDTSFSAGTNIEVKNVDIYGKLKQSPTGSIGSLLYGDNPNSFDNKSFDTINSNGSEINVNSTTTLTYISATDSFTAKPVNSNMTVGDFTNAYIDSLTLINKKSFTSDILNSLFGTLTSNSNKSVNTILNEQIVDETLKKYLSSNQNKSISESELTNLQLKSEELKDGLSYVDVGCARIPNNVTLNSLSSCVDTINNTNNAYAVIGALDSLVDSGFSGGNTSAANKNDSTIKDGFNRKLVNSIQTSALKSVVTSIGVKTLQAIMDDINSNTPNSDPNNLNGEMVDCMTKTVLNSLNKVIFDEAKKEIKSIINVVTKKVAKEKLNQYQGLLKSLSGFNNL